jgi:TRAP-type C4-dicarboxylate transport system permease small subunit
MSTARRSRSPRWYGVPLRVTMLTLIASLLSFSVILLFSLIGVIVTASLRGVHPDMRIAYRQIALPIGAVAAAVIFLMVLIHEVRHYRRAKALTSIERMS